MGKKVNFVAGVAIGAGLGVLFAPKSGAETRAELKDKLNELYRVLQEEYEDFDEIGYDFEDKIAGMQRDLADLDKEKALKIARKQAENIKNKAEDLYQVAKEKGTPVVQKAADDVRKKSAELLHSMADDIDGKK